MALYCDVYGVMPSALMWLHINNLYTSDTVLASYTYANNSYFTL